MDTIRRHWQSFNKRCEFNITYETTQHYNDLGESSYYIHTTVLMVDVCAQNKDLTQL
jgi:hypothetical protein